MSHGTFREAHPLPAVIIHYVHVLSMGVLIFTGFFIHYPFFTASMGAMRYAHFIAMYVILFDLAARVYWAFFGQGSALTKHSRTRGPDWRNFAPQAENRGTLVEMVRYYLFLRPTHPETAKFNTLQKSTYLFWAVLLLVQGYTGFAIYGPFQVMPIFAAFTEALGGPIVVRMLHFGIMWVFIVTTMVHVYLTFAEDVEALALMFLWKETPPSEGA